MLESRKIYLNVNNDLWILHIDGSKYHEGARVGCVLNDPNKNKTLFACRLEFECTSNVAEYEALYSRTQKSNRFESENIKSNR
jgi:hypothetical protein